MSAKLKFTFLILLCANLFLSAVLLSRLPAGKPLSAAPESVESAPQPEKNAPEQPAPPEEQPDAQLAVSMFSWEDEPYLLADRPDFYATLETLGISSVYQSFSDENLYSADTASFLTEMQTSKIAVYLLAGAAEWGLDPAAKAMRTEIDKVAAFNKARAGAGQFSGILFDVEPYLTDQWDEDEDGVFQSFTEAVQTAYAYASSKNIELILCIPNWFDNRHSEQLEQMIATGCDRIAIMNYNRAAEKMSMETEVALAQKYKKPVICIFEFQQTGKHDLTDNETYYNDGIEAAQQSFAALYKEFGYSGLSFSYHYYKPVRELLTKGA